MKPLSSATGLMESGIRRMFDRSQGMQDVISFILGEPRFETPLPIVEAAKKALDAGKTHYSDNAGIFELREAICRSLQSEGGDYAPDEILVCTGAMQAIHLTLAVLLNPGDEVIVTDPCYANYYGQISLNYGIPVPVAVYEEDGFCLTPEHLEKAITPKTKAILLNSPNNPTGAVYSRENLEAIAELCIRNDLYVIFDAVYKRLIYDDNAFFNIASLPEMKERTIYVDSFSKTYAMTGWRLGYLAGPRCIVRLMPKLQEFMPSCQPVFTQMAGIEALRSGEPYVAEMLQAYDESRKALIQRISMIPGLSCCRPAGAFYAFMNIAETGLNSTTFAERLLEKTHVVLAPGTAFGRHGEGFVRVSYAAPRDVIENGMDRIRQFMATL